MTGLTTGESNEVSGVCFWRGGEEVRHLDRNEEGGGASDTNSFDCIRNGTVGGEAAGVE